ncbi:YciI family protein [Halothiobacillus sp. DCM-1]|uniref:YciI family protein n=1 Tax=Halothiobacillus sp. DCM-1 TaxID=3112558 RepID=UPI00324EB22F
MLFAIITTDHPGSLPARLAHRAEHRARIEALAQENRLLTAGPFPAADGSEQFTGSLIVAEFPDLTAAERWAEADPYQREGVYARREIRPYRAVFGATLQPIS